MDFLHFPEKEQHRICEKEELVCKTILWHSTAPTKLLSFVEGGSKGNSTETLFFLAALQHTHENDGHSNPHRRVESTYDIMNVAAPPVTWKDERGTQ